MKRCVLSPHIDDETIDLGGSIAKWVHDGDEVIVFSFFSGGSICNGKLCSSYTRLSELREVSKILGFRSEIVPGLDTFEDRGHLAELKDSSSFVEQFLSGRDAVYFPSVSEHQDHVFVHNVGEIMMRASACYKHISFWEYSKYYDISLEGTFTDITSFVSRKEKALEVFESQKRLWGPVSVRGVLLCNRALGELVGSKPNQYFERAICRRSYE